MVKKLVVLVLVAALALSLGACTKPVETSGPEEEPDKWKIGIMTNTVVQSEEEYRAGQDLLKKYGPEHIIHMTFPDRFMDEQETTIANIVSMASDPDVKALVICQAVPGTAPGIDMAKEIRGEELLIIAGQPQEDPPVISTKADVVFQLNETAMGTTIPNQAKKLGAEVFVHYSFPRHMSYPLLSARRDLMREECARIGLGFVDATSLDPTGDAGTAGSQQFILEDVPRMVEQYGKNTAFFSTNCSQQIPLIAAVVQTGAIYPQPCCPSPYHGFPSALGIDIPEDKKGDIPWLVERIEAALAEKNMTGRLSTWPVPVSMMMIHGGVEYAIAWMNGETDGKLDVPKIQDKFKDYAGLDIDLTVLEEGGRTYPNYLLVLIDFITF